MKLTDLYNKVISKEPYDDMRVFFEDYESFEEIPLVSRYSRLKHLMNEMSRNGVSDFLTGLALFVLNTLRLLEVSRDKDIFFCCKFYRFCRVGRARRSHT
ncbi:Imm15 family immunity protein [Pseudomonas sp. 3MA1]|uniref:Imm15 family immunity protein n=1 Tax=Pseudomonas sp. 3MA1 TaxID=2699196 RepID=UPI0023DDD1D5|nr:Imm15 family immunity protein [Pseudomonas sp. 3MA1]